MGHQLRKIMGIRTATENDLKGLNDGSIRVGSEIIIVGELRKIAALST